MRGLPSPGTSDQDGHRLSPRLVLRACDRGDHRVTRGTRGCEGSWPPVLGIRGRLQPMTTLLIVTLFNDTVSSVTKVWARRVTLRRLGGPYDRAKYA